MTSPPRSLLFLFVVIQACVFVACGSDGESGDAATRKRVFVTSQIFNGALGGLAGADEKCQILAIAAGRSGSYRAWLSDSTDSPSTTFTRSDDPYRLVDGTRIADDWTDLTTNDFLNAIDLDENGAPAPSTSTFCDFVTDWVHTGTLRDGTSNGTDNNCSDWTSALGAGAWGRYSQTDANWSLSCVGGDLAVNCSQMAALYCFEQ
ncbi:MAG: hypothetical protein JRG89_17575 [Deltaproteobacteria bacterium]|nr:hypothetical protein [Deltaproteobacteria bacterium]MBW2390216.1 hypothetical protein [Deltaproteobacteria bacterium]